jgi:hypothetical protein
MRTITIRVRHVRHPWLRWALLALALWLGWSWLAAALTAPGALALLGALAGLAALTVFAADRLRWRIRVPVSVVWFGLASVCLLAAALIL